MKKETSLGDKGDVEVRTAGPGAAPGGGSPPGGIMIEGAPPGAEGAEEEEDPIDMSFPMGQGWKKILVYIISFPIMFPLYITLPDTKDPKS